jgi:CRISPR-associated protein Csb1
MTDPVAVTPAMIDSWADDRRGPVALHLKQKLVPVEGEGAVIFPPTYAIQEKYVIDELADGTKVAQIDSVGSQANRMEPLFKEEPYRDLVPQIEIDLGNRRKVSILDAGHRLGDALVRSTDKLTERAKEAFEAFDEAGDAGPIAKLSPTSLVFGAWDSRGGGAKLARLVNSVIRAWDIDRLHRAAQYVPPVDYAELEVFEEKDKQKAEGDPKNPLAKRGFVHVPAEDVGGGIIARGEIRRDVTVNFVALRRLDGVNGAALRHYILGLALVAATDPQDGFLRQGCLLTPDPEAPARWNRVDRDGTRDAVGLTPEIALEYAQAAAKAFGVGAGGTFEFNKALARADVAKKDA